MSLFFKKLFVFLALAFFVLAQNTPLVFAQNNSTTDAEILRRSFESLDSGTPLPAPVTTTRSNSVITTNVPPKTTGVASADTTENISTVRQITNLAGTCGFGEGWSFYIEGCVAKMFGIIGTLTGWLFWLSATLLNWVVWLTLDSATWLGKGTDIGDAVLGTWQMLRDLANMFFIFVIIYIGISTMLDLSWVDTRKQLVKVITIAILINFSLVVTKVVIDASNVAAFGFYDAFPNAQTKTTGVRGAIQTFIYPVGAKNLAGPFMQATSVTKAVGPEAGEKFVKAKAENPDGEGGWVSVLIALFMFSIMQIIGSFVLFAGGILFITRTALLIILMVFSPIAFICYSTPKLEKYWKQWWDKLLHQAFFAPIFLGFFYVAASIFSASTSNGFFSTENNENGFFGLIAALFIQFALASAFMIIALLSAKALGASGASTLVNWGDKKRKATVGFAGQHTIGRVASAIGNSDTMNKLAGKSPLLAGSLQRGFQKTSQASFGGSKGGYDKRLDRTVENRENIFKNLEKDKDGNYVGGEVELLDEFGNKTGRTGSAAQQAFIDKHNTKQSRPITGWFKSPFSRIFKRRGGGLSEEDSAKINDLQKKINEMTAKKKAGGLSEEEKIEFGIIKNNLDSLQNKKAIHEKRLRQRTRVNRETVRKLIKSKKKKSVEDTLKDLLKDEKEKEGSSSESSEAKKDTSKNKDEEQLTV